MRKAWQLRQQWVLRPDMYSLRLTCPVEATEFVSAELWDAGTVAIGEFDTDEGVTLIAGFETNDERLPLLCRFATYSPEWRHEPARDWIAETQAAWPARVVGERLFLAPVWSQEPTPAGRERIIHNPGLACGTGEHPCTQLALMALEKCVTPGCSVVDIGTGSGLLAITALRLGAGRVTAVDPDEAALAAARENFTLNGFEPQLAVGSADCIATACADVVVANISGTVLLALFDDLLRLTRPSKWMILTGFPESEAGVFERQFQNSEVLEHGEWRCVIARRQ